VVPRSGAALDLVRLNSAVQRTASGDLDKRTRLTKRTALWSWMGGDPLAFDSQKYSRVQVSP